MPPLRLPYRQAGLSDEEAAAHLLGRFTFGPTPGEVDRVAAEGPEAWFEAQLRADALDPAAGRLTRELPALALPLEEAVTRTVTMKGLRERAFEAGAVETKRPQKGSRKRWRDALDAFKQAEGLLTAGELFQAARHARIFRAARGQNQLHEVMAAFWANHLYVGQKPKIGPFLAAYDRDVIRPNALGPFEALLGASARHPAMLLYLDNAESSAPKGTRTTAPRLRQAPGRSKGLNENYARELLELHTLGVDGPYTQDDVVAVARVFSGWHVVPLRLLRQGPEVWDALLDRAGPHRARYVRDGLFLFRADLHDAEPKRALGQEMPAGGGMAEGERVLSVLAAHPDTARHVATQLARRFVSDAPPDALVGALADAFSESGGDARAVLRALVQSPLFWSDAVVRAKVRTPFELVLAAVRGSGARLDVQNGLAGQLAALGEAPFGHLAPDGYPDHASAWINAGTLLNRMRFGVDFAVGQIDGVHLDAERLVAEAGYDPRDPGDALEACLDLFLAGRELDETRELLRPVLEQPAYAQRIAAAAPPPPRDDALSDEEPPSPRRGRRKPTPAPSPAQQALSVVLGSPEFQRQ